MQANDTGAGGLGDSQPNSAKTRKRAGSHIGQACQTCRKRKCKCDGTKPTCAQCSIANFECEYTSQADLRHSPSKEVIKALNERISQLEEEISMLRRQLRMQGQEVAGPDHSAAVAFSRAAVPFGPPQLSVTPSNIGTPQLGSPSSGPSYSSGPSPRSPFPVDGFHSDSDGFLQVPGHPSPLFLPVLRLSNETGSDRNGSTASSSPEFLPTENPHVDPGNYAMHRGYDSNPQFLNVGELQDSGSLGQPHASSSRLLDRGFSLDVGMDIDINDGASLSPASYLGGPMSPDLEFPQFWLDPPFADTSKPRNEEYPSQMFALPPGPARSGSPGHGKSASA